MPSGDINYDQTLIQDYRPSPHTVNGIDHSVTDIFQSVKDQEAQFEQLTRELEEERQSVAYQLEKCKIARENSVPAGDKSVNWPSKNSESNIRKTTNMSGSQLADPCIDQEHVIKGPTDVQESRYNVSYHPTAPNGHHNAQSTYKNNNNTNGNNNPSPNSSQILIQDDPNAQLISRSTSQTRTQQVTTVTKVTREVKHLGPDGQPIDYPPTSQSPYSAGGNNDYQPPHSAGYGSYRNFSPAPPLQQPHDYGTYNSSRGAPSPAVGSTRSYQDYDYHPDYSPRSNVPEDPYSRGRRIPSHDYSQTSPYAPYPSNNQPWEANRPLTPPSPTSTLSTSPLPQRAMPQAPAPANPTDYNDSPGYHPNQPPSGYHELDQSSLQRTLPRDRDISQQPAGADVYGSRHSPSPPPGVDRYGTYGYHGNTGVPTTPSPYSPYEATDRPIGYLDMKPSYADPQTPTGTLGHGPPQGRFNADEAPGEYDKQPNRPPTIDTSDMPRDVRWRDPDLPEVIEFLGNPNNVVRANAAAYLQHLCYMDNDMKQKTRSLGGIPPLVDQLNHDIPEVHRNACGALRNLSYGRSNDENKRAIRNAGGIPALVRLLRKTPDNEVRELVTGILWNLSSCEDLKKPIIDDSLTVITNNVIIPHSGWDRENRPDVNKHHDIYWTTVFRNASGILRNVSSAGEYARKKLRECDGLVDAVLHLVQAAIGKSDIDNKSVENCVCVLRNLSYRCQEVDDPDYDKHIPAQPQSKTVVPSKVGDNLGCFGASKKKKDLAQNSDRQRKDMSMNASSTSAVPRSRSDPAKGMELLWQPEIVQSYLALLSECSNPDTLEASAGALQNLSACYWQPSIDIRASVRKEKGLPILVELLRMENDRVVCAVATALRNLAIDQRNKELIGKYAIRDLVQKLPNGNPQHDTGTSDDTIAAVLATMNEVVKKNSVFARTMVDAGGVDRLMYIQKNVPRFSSRVIKFNQQLLQNLWQHQDLHEAYRRNGWKETNFMTRRPMVVRSQSPHNNTLSRPMSTQGGTKYEDRTLTRGRDLNTSAHNAHSMEPRQNRHPEEMPMTNMVHPPSYHQVSDPSLTGNAHPHHRIPVGGVPIFPPVPQARSPGEPVYAQVNRDRKKNRQFENNTSSQSTLLEHQVPPGGGDSWV